MTGWLAATIGVFMLSIVLGGTRTVDAFGGGGSQTESQRAAQLLRSGTDAATNEELDVVISSPTVGADDARFRATVNDVRLRLSAASTASGPAVADLVDPYAAPADAGLIAPDRAAVRIVGEIAGSDADRTLRSRAVEAVLSQARDANPAFEIHGYSTSLASDEAAAEIARDMDGTILISLPATFLILVLAFGALVAAGIPLALAISALLAAFGIFGIFSRTVEPVSPFAGQFIVLIGLAVAIDYSLFTVSRYRTERRAGRARLDAIEAACATSGRAVLFSGAAVMISLGGLFLLPDSLFQSIAIGTIAVIATSVAGSVVFLPAMLALLGDTIDRGRLPVIGRIRGRGEGVWAGLVRRVMGRPVVALVCAGAALLVLASPVTRMKLGEADMSILPERVDAVRAFNVLEAHWPMGTVVRLDVVLIGGTQAERDAAAVRLGSSLPGVGGLSGPASTAVSADGSARSVEVTMAGTANDGTNWDVVRHVRSVVVPAALGGSGSLTALVGGDAAAAMDDTQVYSDGMVRVLVFVLGFSLILLMVVFRSIAIPVKAILLNLLATGAAFGSMVLVFQEGWLGGLLGVHPISAIQNFIPIFVFTVLFGLSMDYEVFILSRVKEAYDRGHDSHEAVARGISLTAGTVTSAAAIMVVVFSIFLTLPLAIARELGLGLAVAVLVDATLIRCVLLPATMKLLGDWNWWLPGFLSWLPAIHVEGEVAELPASADDHPGGAAMLRRGGIAAAE